MPKNLTESMDVMIKYYIYFTMNPNRSHPWLTQIPA